MSSRFSFLNYGLKTTELLTVNLNSDGSIPVQQFMVYDTFFVSPDVLHELLLWQLAFWCKPFRSLLDIDIKAHGLQM